MICFLRMSGTFNQQSTSGSIKYQLSCFCFVLLEDTRLQVTYKIVQRVTCYGDSTSVQIVAIKILFIRSFICVNKVVALEGLQYEKSNLKRLSL